LYFIYLKHLFFNICSSIILERVGDTAFYVNSMLDEVFGIIVKRIRHKPHKFRSERALLLIIIEFA